MTGRGGGFCVYGYLGLCFVNARRFWIGVSFCMALRCIVYGIEGMGSSHIGTLVLWHSGVVGHGRWAILG